MATLLNGAERAGKRLVSNASLVSAPVLKKKLKTSSIGIAFHSLDLGVVAKHFEYKTSEEDVMVDIEPYILCKDVSAEELNAYVESTDKLAISLRFLELRGSDLIIIDWPTRTHESVIRKFESKFLLAFGDDNSIAQGGSFTASRGGNPSKEADATFGPLRNTPHRQNPPAGIGIGEWVTLAVEVAVSQNWKSLENAALWWASYPGVQYIVCIKVSPKARRWRYRLYSINQVGVLPAPQVDQQFCGAIDINSYTLTFDARRILAIPEAQPLPAGVNAQIIVDLFHVVNCTTQSI
jgi:hypothetical protein